MKLANIVLVDKQSVRPLRDGGNYEVSGPTYIRMEPAFIFEGHTLRICILDTFGHRVFEHDRSISRDTIAVFQEMPKLTEGEFQLVLSIGCIRSFVCRFETDGTGSMLLSGELACTGETNYNRLRYLIQSQPFGLMLRDARSSLDANNARLVFITGSVGKTTTKECLSHVLGFEMDLIASTDSWNFPHEICSQIQNNISWCRLFVMEAALGQHLRIMGELLPPDVFIFTAVGEVHTAFTADVSTIAKQKASLAAHMRAGSSIICDMEDNHIAAAIEELEPVRDGRSNVIGLSMSGPQDGRISVVRSSGRFEIEDRVNKSKLTFECPSTVGIPDNVVGCSFAAWQVLSGARTDIDKFVHGIETFPGVPGRLEKVQAGRVVILNDAYNANPLSMRRFFAHLSEFGVQGLRVLAVVGEMRDLGVLSGSAHDLVIAQACAAASRVIFVGEQYREGADIINCECLTSANLEELETMVIAMADDFDVVAFKGSYATGLINLAQRIIVKMTSAAVS